MSHQIRVPKYYQWVFWHYDGTVHPQYIPDHPDPLIVERTINEVKDYHDKISKVKRGGWVALSEIQAAQINAKSRYVEVISKKLGVKIIELHGKWPFITRRLDIRYYGARAGEHEYYYVIGRLSGKEADIIKHRQDDGKFLIEHINGSFDIIDKQGNTRNDTTSEVIPPIPPEAADDMEQIKREISTYAEVKEILEDVTDIIDNMVFGGDNIDG